MYHPPLDPASNPTSSSMTQKRMMVQKCGSDCKLRRLGDVVEEGNVMQIKPNIKQENNLVESEVASRPQTSEPTAEEKPQNLSAKLQLHNLCCTRRWKAPIYECSAEGPGHMKLFTVKATVEIKEEGSGITVLDCFSDPQQKKKIASEQAAEAALWYLKNVGLSLQTLEKKASGRQGQTQQM